MTAKSSKAAFTVTPPKKSPSAYNLWMADERQKKKESNQQLSFTEFGQLWKELPEAQRQHYQLLAAKDKERFDREMTLFKQSPNYAVYLQEKKDKAKADKEAPAGKGTKRKSAPKDPNAPKKISGFILFSNEARQSVKAEHPNATFAEISKHISTRWNALSDAEKQKVKDRASAMSTSATAKPAAAPAKPVHASKKKAVEPEPEPEEEEEEEENEVEVEEEEEEEEEEEAADDDDDDEIEDDDE